MFDDEETVARKFQIVRKLPYKFSYRFEDKNGKQSTLMIEDWEIGMLFWNCLKKADGNEEDATQQVRQKYWDQFVESEEHDLTLILGTTLQHHRKRALNPFVIVSVFYPKSERQGMFFFGV